MNVEKLFPGKISTTPQKAAFATLDQSFQTTNNQLYQGRFPIPVTLLGGKRMVLLDDLQDFIDSARHQPVKKRRGRPTKVEQMKKKMGGDHE